MMTETKYQRIGTATRNTKETQIAIKANLDGTGQYDIDTSIGFFDHMLSQLSKHSLIDLNIKAKGDTHIDFHHLVEDCGYALGLAFAEALGEKAGIERFGHAFSPMDETLTRVALDLSGRPYLVYHVTYPTQKLGVFDTELFKEFYQALALGIGANIHIETLYGGNSHHIAESGFKALARALKHATRIDPQAAGQLPSTKGSLKGAKA
ncbi:MAG: imidazoleglycerol-phosphate dehydratase HisB [Alphaproteobacteria bacterium]